MAQYSLIPLETLLPLKNELFARMADPASPVEPESGEVGEALAWWLLFERWPELLPGPPLDEANAFYNRYFWFKRFATLKQKRDGPNAGLEQQVFKQLEQVDFEVDWEVMEQLDAEAANI